jgi:hypothetical protein
MLSRLPPRKMQLRRKMSCLRRRAGQHAYEWSCRWSYRGKHPSLMTTMRTSSLTLTTVTPTKPPTIEQKALLASFETARHDKASR